MTTPVSSMMLVAFGSFIGSFGAVGLKAGAKRLEKNLASLVTNWPLALGIGGYLLSSVFFILGVRRGDLSVLFPMVSLGYIWTTIWSKVFFAETLTTAKLAGLGMILAGCVLLGLGNS